MFVTPSLVTLALVLSSSASPAPDAGTIIDYHTHNSLIKADGMLDHEAAIEQVFRDKKYVVYSMNTMLAVLIVISASIATISLTWS